jgi:hypothetical protein
MPLLGEKISLACLKKKIKFPTQMTTTYEEISYKSILCILLDMDKT